MKLQPKTRTILLIAGTVLTLGLVAAVVLISLRLQQVGTTPVTPTTPASRPQAVEEKVCVLDFTVTETSEATCVEKEVYDDTSTYDPNKPQAFSLDPTHKIDPATAKIAPGTILIFNLVGADITTATSGDIVWTDVLDNNLEFINSIPSCSFNTTTKTFTCNRGTLSLESKKMYSVPLRVKVKDTATGTISNTATVTTGGKTPKTCSVSLTIQPKGSAVCSAKEAYSDDPDNKKGSYDLTGHFINPGTTVKPGTNIVFYLRGTTLNAGTTGDVVWTDILDSNFEFVDGDDCVDYNPTTRTVTCNRGTKTNGGESYNAAFRVKVKSDIKVETISNTATVTTAGKNESKCSTDVKVELTKTDAGFRVEKYEDKNSNQTRDDGEQGLAWDFEWDLNGDNNWRAYRTNGDGSGDRVGGLKEGDKIRVREKGKDGWTATTATQLESTLKIGDTYTFKFGNKPRTVTGCNNSCVNSSDCASGLTCLKAENATTGVCRNPSCTERESCACISVSPTPTPTPPTTPELPKAGSTGQSAIMLIGGTIITVLGVLGFLAF